MTQPSVTALLQRVEGLVGGRLFERSHAGVTPTPVGRRLLRRARQVLLEYDGLVEEVRAGSRQGPVRLGASHMDCLTTPSAASTTRSTPT
ncbi:LysR family transcriptional regulator [Actinokineospora soli]|uniref:LysR family transcriptional regulator n=1 Tax=Actinokineospora soli TaxID=1048753 RepID=A0ABW2TTT5_9PSEU